MQIKEQISLIAKSKYNPLNNIIIFCLLPIIFNFCNAFYHRPVYMTSDDSEMRFVLDGTLAGKYLAEPSEFSLYMNTLYGKILKFFYEEYQQGYWYDIFTYLFISLSLFIMTVACCKNFAKETKIKKLIVLFVLAMITSPAFLTPQFTITSGMLAISGVLSFYMLVNSYFSLRAANVLCGLYCIAALFFSSIVRFECCMICSFFTGIVLLPYWPFQRWKNILKKSWVVIMALLTIGYGAYCDYNLINATPHWNELRQANNARVEIADKTDMWNHLTNPWKNIEAQVDALTYKNYNFSKGYYRLLLTYLPFGNKDVFSAENLEKVSKELAPKVQTTNSIHAGFRIKDYKKTFLYFFSLFFILSVFFLKDWKKSGFIITSFFLLIIFLNCEFRALPYRLWYNFAIITVVALMLSERTIVNNKNIFFKIFSLVILILSCYCSYNIMNKHNIYTKEINDIFKQIKGEIKHLSKKSVYMTNYSFNEHIVAPFRENIFYKNKLYSYGWLNMAREKMIQDHNISLQDTWIDICRPNNKFRFLAAADIYNPYIDIKKSVSYFMKEKYGKTVGWVTEYPTPNLITYQCHILTDKEIWLRKKYKKEVIDVFEADNDISLYAEKYGKNKKEKQEIIKYLQLMRYTDWKMLRMKFTQKYLGKKATLEQIDKFLDTMEYEVIEEETGD